jgi:hypothetical protein
MSSAPPVEASDAKAAPAASSAPPKHHREGLTLALTNSALVVLLLALSRLAHWLTGSVLAVPLPFVWVVHGYWRYAAMDLSPADSPPPAADSPPSSVKGAVPLPPLPPRPPQRWRSFLRLTACMLALHILVCGQLALCTDLLWTPFLSPLLSSPLTTLWTALTAPLPHGLVTAVVWLFGCGGSGRYYGLFVPISLVLVRTRLSMSHPLRKGLQYVFYDIPAMAIVIAWDRLFGERINRLISPMPIPDRAPTAAPGPGADEVGGDRFVIAVGSMPFDWNVRELRARGISFVCLCALQVRFGPLRHHCHVLADAHVQMEPSAGLCLCARASAGSIA